MIAPASRSLIERELIASELLTRVGAVALANSPHLAGPPSPALAGHRRPERSTGSITHFGAKSLADASLLDHVDDLTLAGNPIGPAGIEALATSAHARRLRHLRVCGCAIRDAGATAIGHSGWTLETLDIAKCGLFNCAALAGADFLGALTWFNIDDNPSLFQDRRSVEALVETDLAQSFKDDLRYAFERENE